MSFFGTAAFDLLLPTIVRPFNKRANAMPANIPIKVTSKMISVRFGLDFASGISANSRTWNACSVYK